MTRVLVIGPHPNSGIVGCGGSIVKHIESGYDVYMVSLTRGDASNLEYSRKDFAKLTINQ